MLDTYIWGCRVMLTCPRWAASGFGSTRERPSEWCRHRKRDYDGFSAAQQQRERQAAFQNPPVAAAAPAPAGNPIDIGEPC